MTRHLEGKVAIVTGAGRGLGWGIARELAAQGAKVVLNDLGTATTGEGADRSIADAAVERIRAAGGEATANYDSVADYRSAGRIIQAALDTYGRLDILVNNAGNQRHGMLWEIGEEEWRAVIEVHLNGTFFCTRHAAPHMMAQRSGVIINVFSTASVLGNPNHSPYAAAKHGIIGFTNAAANELGPYGIRVNVFSPGAVRSHMSADFERRFAAGQVSERLRAHLPLGMIDPEENGAFIAYLCTDHAKNIHGQAFRVYGRYIGWYPKWEVAESIFKPEGRWTVEELITAVPLGMRGAIQTTNYE